MTCFVRFLISEKLKKSPTTILIHQGSSSSATKTISSSSTAATTCNVPDIVSHIRNEKGQQQQQPHRPPRRKKKSSISQVREGLNQIRFDRQASQCPFAFGQSIEIEACHHSSMYKRPAVLLGFYLYGSVSESIAPHAAGCPRRIRF